MYINRTSVSSHKISIHIFSPLSCGGSIYRLFVRFQKYLIVTMTSSPCDYVMNLSVTFPSRRYAEIAYNTLRVDKEPPRGGCKKTLHVNDTELAIKLEAPEARTLRNASNACLDFLMVVTETMKRFDIPVINP